MRKLLIPILMLSCAAPALAGPGGRDHGGRGEGSPSVERIRDSGSDDDDRRSKSSANSSSQADAPRPRGDGARRAAQQDEGRRAPLANSPARIRPDSVQQHQRQERADAVRTWREGERRQSTRPALERREAPVLGSSDARRSPVRDGVRIQPAIDLSQRTVAQNWRNQWRRDSRYDWRSHRARNRSLFRIGFYYDPFGYSYRRFGYGYTLYPAYYSNRYWLNDPFMYRLPPAWGPYRWVRYWDDALLVDLRTGRVVDVIYDFFW